MLIPRGKFGIAAASYSFEGGLNRNRVLFCIFYAFDTSYSVGMSLTNALAPECVVFSIRENGIGIHSVEGEQTGIPAY